MHGVACFPARFPTGLPPVVAEEEYVPPQHRPRLDRALVPAIAERARCESLRDLAAEYGVSHETIRAVVRRTRTAARAAALAAG
jgi:hypothetical protein